MATRKPDTRHRTPGSGFSAGFRRLRALMRKEFLHIIRDPRSLGILFILPVAMMLLFGYAVRLDVKNITLAVWDQDVSRESRELIDAFRQSGYFDITSIEFRHENPQNLFLSGNAMTYLSIPRGYGRSISRGNPEPVQFIIDAAESNSATIAAQYAEIIAAQYLWKSIPGNSRIDIHSLILFNPELKSTYNIVPGLVAVLFMMVCALLTSVTIVREKETGTMEQILVSPIRVREIIMGKVIPYVVLSGILGLIVILFSMTWFHVPFVGNAFNLALFSLVYLLCALSFGILISTRATTMQVALMIALVTTMLPSVMLSGFIFPIASMPAPIQTLTRIVPARYYLVIIRAIMLKGAASETLTDPLIAMVIFAAIVLVISIKRFKASLE